jgi:DNA invertase Pin-like site-specific DNA recombinase
MIVGYARPSSAAQVKGLEGQVHDLQATGYTRIFSEQVSARSAFVSRCT